MVTEKASEGEEFRLVTGEEVRSIQELWEYLREISEEEYSHHVNEERNDFAAWVRGVHGENDLADRLEEAGPKKRAEKVLREEVKKYYKSGDKSKRKRDEEYPVSTDHGEFLTKEFIYGLIFGFILGVLAAGILTAL